MATIKVCENQQPCFSLCLKKINKIIRQNLAKICCFIAKRAYFLTKQCWQSNVDKTVFEKSIFDKATTKKYCKNLL